MFHLGFVLAASLRHRAIAVIDTFVFTGVAVVTLDRKIHAQANAGVAKPSLATIGIHAAITRYATVGVDGVWHSAQTGLRRRAVPIRKASVVRASQPRRKLPMQRPFNPARQSMSFVHFCVVV